MYNILVNCEFFHVISYINKLKETSDKKQKEEREAFQNSRDNMLRSVATYYTAGVMGKRKYQVVPL